MTARALPLIDGWVNENDSRRPVDPTVGKLFPGLHERRKRGTSIEQLIEEMDGAGVAKAMLAAGYAGNDNLGWVEKSMERHPDRFGGSLVVDPRDGMAAVRALERAVRDSGVRMARVIALYTQLPYDHASYYPVYAKCVELGIPIGVNVGLPGPPVAGRCQDPIALDDVCAFFPELVVVMSHGGDPWADMCVKLMSKWPNLYYMSSAYSPRRIPPEIIDYLNGRGADKVMWASDYPVLEFARCREQILAMPLRDEERRRKFAHDNALRVLFGQSPTDGDAS